MDHTWPTRRVRPRVVLTGERVDNLLLLGCIGDGCMGEKGNLDWAVGTLGREAGMASQRQSRMSRNQETRIPAQIAKCRAKAGLWVHIPLLIRVT